MPASIRFPGYSVDTPLPSVAENIPLFTEPNRLRDVARAFDCVRTHGDVLSIWDGGLIPDFRYTRVNIGTKGRARNHFQGIQRLRDGQHLVISGGDLNQPASHVFIARMSSCSSTSAWGCNLLFSREPSLNDSVVRTIAFDRKLWHAGGLALLGDVLAIPIEGDDASRIVFVDLADPEDALRIDCDIDRPDRRAGAVGLGRLGDGRFFCAVWWEVPKRRPPGRVDFYVSRSDDLRAGFLTSPAEWSYGDAKNAGTRDPAYQCVNVLHETSGALYLLAMENGSAKAPIFAGPDTADLYHLALPPEFADDPALHPPELTLVRSRRFFCRDEFGNFDAAGGAYVDEHGALHLYTAFHWRVDDTLRLTEFSCEPAVGGEAPEELEQSWIELYEHDSFRGRRLTIRGLRFSRLENYGRVLVDGSSFDDRVSSVRFRLPEGRTYRLFRDPDFKGSRPGKDFLDLAGTGQLVELRNLADGLNFGDRVSSSCYL